MAVVCCPTYLKKVQSLGMRQGSTALHNQRRLAGHVSLLHHNVYIHTCTSLHSIHIVVHVHYNGKA